MATLGTAFAIPFMMSGGKKEAPGAKNTPPINASSKEEESFITYVLRLFCTGMDGVKKRITDSNHRDFIKDMEKEDKKA